MELLSELLLQETYLINHHRKSTNPVKLMIRLYNRGCATQINQEVNNTGVQPGQFAEGKKSE